MAILSLFKGENKAENGGGKQPAQEQQKRPDIKRHWTAGDMRQINRTTAPQLRRTNSGLSGRSSKYRTGRQDWAAPMHKAASLKSQGRTASYQGLAKVPESDHDEDQYAIPPVPALSDRYSTGSSASSSRQGASKSAHGASGSTSRKSPLSSAETSPADSEDSSNASSKSEDVLEMRSHPFSHPQQFVFHKKEDSKVVGKGKAPMYPVGESVQQDKQQNNQTAKEDDNAAAIESSRKHRYFTRPAPTEVVVPDAQSADSKDSHTTGATSTAAAGSPPKASKKSRFNLFPKKSDQSVTA